MQRLVSPRLLSAACLVVAAASAAPASAQLFTPYAQSRSLDVRAEAQVPPQTSTVDTDGRQEESQVLGGFDRSLSADAAAGAAPGSPSASSGAVAEHAIDFGPSAISGRLMTTFTFVEQEGWTGGSADATFSTEFRAEQTAPMRFTARGVIQNRGGYFVSLIDLDQDDPHGGPLGLFGVGMSSNNSDDRPYDFSTTMQAGHRYQLNVIVETDFEILRNPPLTRNGTLTGDFTFTLAVPEPSGAAIGLLACVTGLLSRRRR